MGLVKKVDYYCGAFISYLVSKGSNPTLFEGTDNSKIAKFTIDSSDFKVYIKYSATCKKSTYDGKSCRKWDMGFTDREIDILYNFYEDNHKMYVVNVCTDEKMNNTEIAILDFREAMECLGRDNVNETRRITIIHKKGSKYLNFYGTAVDKKNAYTTLKNFESYFKEKNQRQLVQG